MSINRHNYIICAYLLFQCSGLTCPGADNIHFGILGLSIIALSAFLSWNMSSREIGALKNDLNQIKISYSDTSTKLENLLYLNSLNYS